MLVPQYNAKDVQQLYNCYGMWLLDELKMNSKKNAFNIQYSNMSELFSCLNNIAERFRGRIPQISAIDDLLKGKETVISFNSNDEKSAVIKKMLVPFAVRCILNVSTSEYTLADLLIIYRMAAIVRNSTIIRFVVVQLQLFTARVPAFINQLSSITIDYIPVVDDMIVVNRKPFLEVFKKWVVVSEDLRLHQNITPETMILVNDSTYPDSYIRKKLKVNKVTIYSQPYSQVEFESSSSINKVSFAIKRNRLELLLKKNGYMMTDNFTQYQLYAMPNINSKFGLGSESKVKRIVDVSQTTLRLLSVECGNRILSRIDNSQFKSVNLVFIGNKGTGKTSFLSIYKQLLERYLSDSNKPTTIGHISSDAYGRWLYLNRNIPCNVDSVKYEDIQSMDNNMTKSYFNEFALKLLDKHQIYSIDELSRLVEMKPRSYLRSKLDNVFIEFDAEFLRLVNSSQSNGESQFYRIILASKSRPRIMIIETHTHTQLSVTADTDTSCRLETFYDDKLAVKQRDRASIEEVFLHYYYSTHIGNRGFSATPLELILALKLRGQNITYTGL